MLAFDLLIENGTIVDGRRNARFVDDVGIRAGKVAAVTGGDGLSQYSAE